MNELECSLPTLQIYAISLLLHLYKTIYIKN